MIRQTSVDSYSEVKQTCELSQSEKIKVIISEYEGISMSEILRAYRSRYGAIELSSVSARCNKLKKDGEIEERSTRPCTVSGKNVHILWIKGACTHDKFRAKNYVQLQNMEKGTVWHGKIIESCPDCGQDISKYRLVEIKNHQEYMRGLKYG